MEKEIIVKEGLEKKKEAFLKGGAEKFHVLADFDRTLTQAFVEGEYIPAVIWVLYNGNYLGEGYVKKAQELHKKYHNTETDPQIPREEKVKAMRQWWIEHFDLLIRSGLSLEVIEKVVDSGKIKLREGADEFIDLLKENNVPLVIMSSGGLGGDSISMFLKKKGKLYNNIHIISNSFEWDKEGKALAIKEPIIHGMNKRETAVKDYPVFEKVKERKNVLLLGDNLDDIDMIEGFDCDNLISVGFLNKDVDRNLQYYKEKYDIVVSNDGSMEYLNRLLKDMF